MAERLSFRNPNCPTLDELESLIQGNDALALSDALIGLALGSSEPDEAYALVSQARFMEHPDPGVRGAAILSLGHLARIHRHVPVEPTVTLIRRALLDEDQWVRSQAENARSDIEVYVPSVAARLAAREDDRSVHRGSNR